MQLPSATIVGMSSYGVLKVGPIVASRLRDGVGNELLAVFRDEMIEAREMSDRDYEIHSYGSSSLQESYEQVEVTEFRAPGKAIADRLDIIGVDPATALYFLDHQLHDQSGVIGNAELMEQMGVGAKKIIEADEEFLTSLNAERWVELLAASDPDDPEEPNCAPGSRWWLLGQIAYMDDRFALRLVLLAFPSEEVVLDATALRRDGWLDDTTSPAADAAFAITGMAGMHAPVVVLTEGRTDAEFLRAGVQILYPHLTDLIRFLDYEQRPEGGAAALIRMVRAFAAAGIVNRVIAAFDNDTAATDALRALNASQLPDQIRIIQYPNIELARSYPTLGPPTMAHPSGSSSSANVNGLAGSIELYLGTDSLTQSDGNLYPVQWGSFIPGVGAYQGEVMHKNAIHDAFRAKYAVAQSDPTRVGEQDWEGIRAILDAIRTASQTSL